MLGFLLRLILGLRVSLGKSRCFLASGGWLGGVLGGLIVVGAIGLEHGLRLRLRRLGVLRVCAPRSPIVLLVLLGQGVDNIAGALVAEDRLEVLVLRLLDLAGGLVEL